MTSCSRMRSQISSNARFVWMGANVATAGAACAALHAVAVPGRLRTLVCAEAAPWWLDLVFMGVILNGSTIKWKNFFRRTPGTRRKVPYELQRRGTELSRERPANGGKACRADRRRGGRDRPLSRGVGEALRRNGLDAAVGPGALRRTRR